MISFAAIIYTGELAPYFDRGVGLTLLGGAVISMTGALFLSYKGTIAQSQDVPAILLAGAAATLVTGQQLSGGGSVCDGRLSHRNGVACHWGGCDGSWAVPIGDARALPAVPCDRRLSGSNRAVVVSGCLGSGDRDQAYRGQSCGLSEHGSALEMGSCLYCRSGDRCGLKALAK